MNFLFLVDRYEKWHIDKDTSFALMQGAQRKGHQIYRFFTGDAYLRDGNIFIAAEHVKVQANANHPFEILSTKTLTGNDMDAVFIRTDPPFNETYLMQTWLLDRLPNSVAVMNNPTGIRTCNEKIWATQFAEIMPPTMISSKRDALLEFVQRYPNTIAKPTDGFGGKGIRKINPENAESILYDMTFQFNKETILQEYIPEAELGDKRILLLNGEPLGAVLRVHGADDFRNNFMAGGSAKKTTINENDRKIINTLKPHLQKEGLYFVGIDILGPFLTEVNVTSPTCVLEINSLENTQLEDQIITFAEKLIDQSRNLPKI